MRIKVRKRELAEIISVIGKIINKTTKLTILKSVKFSVKEEVLTISATNLEHYYAFKHSYVTTEGNFEAIIPYYNLKEVLMGDRSGEINFDFNFVSKSVKITEVVNTIEVSKEIALLEVDDFPEFPNISKQAMSITVSSGFLEHLDIAARIARTNSDYDVDSSRGGVNINKNGIVGTNGNALIHINYALDLSKSVSFKAPHSSILKMNASECIMKLGIDAKFGRQYISFESKQTTFVSRLLEGTYPNWKAVIPEKRDLNTCIRFSPKEITNLLVFLKSILKNASKDILALNYENGMLIVNSFESFVKVATSIPVEVIYGSFSKPFGIRVDCLYNLLILGHDTIEFRSESLGIALASGGIGNYVFHVFQSQSY